MTNDTQPSVKFEGEVDIKLRSTPMTNDTRPSVRPVVGHHAKLRNGIFVPNIRIDPPDTRYWSEAFVTVCTWDESGKSSEWSAYDVIATISPEAMALAADGSFDRLIQKADKMATASKNLAEYANSLHELVPLADAACDYADQNCRAFPIATAPRDGTAIMVWDGLWQAAHYCGDNFVDAYAE
jgi:hypothetical protein